MEKRKKERKDKTRHSTPRTDTLLILFTTQTKDTPNYVQYIHHLNPNNTQTNPFYQKVPIYQAHTQNEHPQVQFHNPTTKSTRTYSLIPAHAALSSTHQPTNQPTNQNTSVRATRAPCIRQANQTRPLLTTSMIHFFASY